MNNAAQPYLARPDSTAFQAPPPVASAPPITLAGSQVWAETLLAEWHGAEVWIPGPWPPRLGVQTEAAAVLL